MAISINWGTSVIFVPQADLTFLGGSLYQLDVDSFRLTLKSLEAAFPGMPYFKTHRHNTEVILSGVPYARIIEILAPYTIEFEDGNYTVSCIGANHNIADVKVVNSVSLIVNNAAGLISAPIDKVLRAVESQRGSHAGTGRVWFLDPINGNDTNSGVTSTNAFKTWATTDTFLSSDDVVYLVANPAMPVTMMRERIVMTKSNVHVRGPGVNFHFHPLIGNDGTVLSMGTDAAHVDGCSLSGFTVNTDAAIGDGINVFGDNNLLQDINIKNVPEDGLCAEDSKRLTMRRVFVNGPGGDGVCVKHCDDTIIEDFNIANVGDVGVRVLSNISGDSVGTDIINTAIENAPVGIDIGTGSLRTRVRADTRFVGNVPVHILDNGTDTHNEAAASQGTIRTGMAQGSGTGPNQIQLDSSAPSVSGSFDPSMVQIIAGPGSGQARGILEYDGPSRTATVDRNWKVSPTATSVYRIIPYVGREHVNEGLARGGGTNSITLNALASSTDGAYSGQLCFIRSGTGDDQVGKVTTYNGTTKVAEIEKAWAVIPDTTSGYVMMPILHSLDYEGKVFVDTVLGEPGVLHPIGTRLNPVNNISDAVTIANALNLTTLRLNTDAVVLATDDISGLEVEGIHPLKVQLNIDEGAGTDKCQFRNIYLKNCAFTGWIVIRESLVENSTGFRGVMHETMLNPGVLKVAPGADAFFLSCYSGEAGAANPIIDVDGKNLGISLRGFRGGITIRNNTANNSISIDLSSGEIVLENTVTNGLVICRGVGKLIDNSTGTTVVIDELVSVDAVWDEASADHVAAGTMGALLKNIRQLIDDAVALVLSK